MAIKTPKGYRVISGISKESLDAYIQSFTFGSGEKILVGRSNTLDLTITRGTRTSDGAGNALQIQGGQATGTNQVGGDVNIFTGYPTGNAASGDFQVFGAASKAASGSSVNPANATMLSISGDTGDATFANDIIIGGDEITNTGSNNDLILTSDKDIYFSIDKDEDTTNNKFVFRKGGSSNPFVEIAELDESGNLQIDGSLTIGSTEVINSSGVLQVATQGTIDHDSLANFVAEEHYRWDTDISGTATINAANIPTLNQNTTGQAGTVATIAGLAPNTATTAASQPNITSLGTLTGLTTSGDVTIGGDLTVTSGTSGDATLIIEADTDNNNENDLPRLWFKADGDITEGAIQLQNNTLDIINNISAVGGIRFLTGTTNNTGTTDPQNGATERMSISSQGLVTVAGALQSDTIELGHASDTTLARSAAGKVTIEGANVQTTQICCTHHNMSLDGGSSTVDYYFPINSLADGSSSGLYYTRVLSAYDGKIVKIILRGNSLSGNTFGTNCTIYMSRRAHDNASYYHQSSGFQASETFNLSTQTTVVVPCGVGGANASDWVFEEGDMLGFSVVKDTTATDIDLTATIVWEYTV